MFGTCWGKNLQAGRTNFTAPVKLEVFALSLNMKTAILSTQTDRSRAQANLEGSEDHIRVQTGDLCASLCCRKPLGWFQRRVYEWDPNFKFPNRIIGTAIISLIGLYTVQHHPFNPE